MEKGCPKCGRTFDMSLKNCPYCGYDFKEIDNFFKKIDSDKYLEDEKYAGFVKRLVAGFFDMFIIGNITILIVYLLNMLLNFNWKISLILVFLFLYVLINSIFERTSFHGSLGKRIVGIEVFDEYENPLTFSAALLRNMVKFVNILTLGFGFLMCSSGDKKMTLGDMITKNNVLSRVSFTEIDNIGYCGIFRRFFAFLIDVVFISGTVYFLISLPLIIELFKINIPVYLANYLDIVLIIICITFVCFYVPFFESRNGTSIGKKILGIKVICVSGEDVNFPLCFVRQFLMLLDIITFGWMLPISNVRRQTLKDIITKTVVIYW